MSSPRNRDSGLGKRESSPRNRDSGLGKRESSPYETEQEFMAYLDGLEERGDLARIEAFGAIRRAAEVMRWHENNAKRLAPLRPDGLNEYEAKAIRRAIRAAIGSEKT